MAHTDEYKTVIQLNTQQAKKEIDVLQKKYDDLVKKQSQYASDSTKYKSLQKEIDKTKSKMESMQNRVTSVTNALTNMSKATPKQLKDTIKDINKLLNSGDIKRGSDDWKRLTSAMKQANTELAKIKNESKASQSTLGKLFKFLNDSWGGILILVQSISGMTMTIRRSVENYAQMEEEMANVRKYTGLADEKVRELNEDLKKIDTRTPREKLNQLAGTAGRLGKDSKKDILEFVEAANMIEVALGEDLGDDAIDKVGKLAMAFGEDEKKGLKGAMLSTGSAINELAQNSSAQAGYLVDYTARVAGFGKQLGLTQAQIMGYGAVMDENLLRDEMAATAFGNMLTKMQTDTDKFARIAGMNVKEFADLLKNDANAAILALADNLKKADPQTMMKMLDDMGLDGSRAVGVLSTLADKIDDVRERQELAAKAYNEGISIQKEYDTMNNTVQANIEKAKKRFHELSVELGERLQPTVLLTVKASSLFVQVLNTLIKFVAAHIRGIVAVAVALTALTVVYKAAEIKVYGWYLKELLLDKLHRAQTVLMKARIAVVLAYKTAVALLTGNLTRAAAAMRLMRAAALSNPYTALLTVVLALGTAIYASISAWKKHQKAIHDNLQEVKNLRAQMQLQKDMDKQVSESTAERKTKIEQLTRVIHSNAYSVSERRNAIKALQKIVPDYHASIGKEGELYNDNKNAIKEYIQKLEDAALAEAIYAKKVEINKKKLDLGYKENRIKGSLKAVQAYRDTQQQTKEEEWVDQDGRVHKATLKTKSAIESDRQQKIHEERLANVHSEQKVVEAEDQYLDSVLKKNEKVNKLYTEKVTSSTTNTDTTTQTTPTQYTPQNGNKKPTPEQEEKEKVEAMRKAAKEAKGIMDAQLADNMLRYQAGEQDYRQFMNNQLEIQTRGLEAQRDAWEEGYAERARYQKQLAALQLNGEQEQKRLEISEMERDHQMMMARLKDLFEDENSAYYQNEVALNDALHAEDIEFLMAKRELYREGSLERMQIEWEIEDKEEQHKLERQRTFQQMVEDLKTAYLQQGDAKREKLELNALEQLHKEGLLKEEEYQRAKLAIKAQYAQAQTPDEKTAAAGADMLKVAQTAASGEAGTGTSIPISGTISMYMATMDKLKELYGQDEQNHEAYLAAKQQATSQFCQQLASEFQTAYQSIGELMSSASSYYSAQSDYEVAMTKKKYEKQIEAAGNNQKRVKKLQEQQAKEEAAIKTKYNKKQVKIQIAQALAQTAQNALSAYGSAAAIPVVGYILAPIAAAMAVAAGMMQVATIQKQAQVQEAGYYEGGFTGGKQYRKKAGIVHEGEFVANHQAVNNPNVLPMLQFLDKAQRNNTVGSLTAQDVSRSMGLGGTTQMITPIVNVQNDNEELRGVLEASREASEDLRKTIEEGIPAYAVIEGPRGLYKKLKDYERLIDKK